MYLCKDNLIVLKIFRYNETLVLDDDHELFQLAIYLCK